MYIVVNKKNKNKTFFMTGFSKKFENKKKITNRNIKLFEEKIVNKAFYYTHKEILKKLKNTINTAFKKD